MISLVLKMVVSSVAGPNFDSPKGLRDSHLQHARLCKCGVDWREIAHFVDTELVSRADVIYR